ncbi:MULTISPECIES: hypothetical protein [Rhodopseudomonas]|uniref:hypothetical protein n=1 Tax=Rhodopseudomonas TaxID=1073 RepID=UPI0009BBCFF2|nr:MULTISPECIES: hypothetical protein [Rhodopseudomonas]MDF3813622.1 hypothetical protein [Rhodopseudomonas sp. BAL398]WOK17022.1 hypothetical protein RBJ75_23285 [Rhodopseudomonas sp. BAL398]
MTYKISAARENEKMESERASSLIAIAKARIWASEGWLVVITDEAGREFIPAQFDELSPFRRPAPVDKSPELTAEDESTSDEAGDVRVLS